MPTKPRNFDPRLYYHIYNRGVEKRTIFLNAVDYQRFLGTVDYYLYEQKICYAQYQDLDNEAKNAYNHLNPKGLETPRVMILACCLMPNHFHLLIKPVREDGITRFSSDLANSYTRYFNIKNERAGNLFQGTFQAKDISDEASLLQLSRYIHLNPPNPYTYPYSSYQDWINPRNPKLVDRTELNTWLKIAGGVESYKAFVDSKIDQNPALGIEDLVLDDDTRES